MFVRGYSFLEMVLADNKDYFENFLSCFFFVLIYLIAVYGLNDIIINLQV